MSDDKYDILIRIDKKKRLILIMWHYCFFILENLQLNIININEFNIFGSDSYLKNATMKCAWNEREWSPNSSSFGICII